MREEDRQQLAEVIRDQLAPLWSQMTEAVSRLGSNQLNGVIRTETITLDATGIAHRHSRVPIAAVSAWAYAGGITVVSGTTADEAPTDGIGVVPITGGQSATFPLTGSEITVYGNPGDRVLLTLWSVPQNVAVGGAGPIDGGGA